jgi:hypothetical protein
MRFWIEMFLQSEEAPPGWDHTRFYLFLVTNSFPRSPEQAESAPRRIASREAERFSTD